MQTRLHSLCLASVSSAVTAERSSLSLLPSPTIPVCRVYTPLSPTSGKLVQVPCQDAGLHTCADLPPTQQLLKISAAAGTWAQAPTTPASGRLKQGETPEFVIILGYITRTCLKSSHPYTQTHTLTHIYTHRGTHKHSHNYIFTNTHIRSHTRKYPHSHTNTHTQSHSQTPSHTGGVHGHQMSASPSAMWVHVRLGFIP